MPNHPGSAIAKDRKEKESKMVMLEGGTTVARGQIRACGEAQPTFVCPICAHASLLKTYLRSSHHHSLSFPNRSSLVQSFNKYFLFVNASNLFKLKVLNSPHGLYKVLL